ncbi:PQQ-dependent sugar dehydrogenase [Solemya velesiana gill symbiont]|uniref:Glucose dehydrogenase n=1 Tax=Solemya velesiana gill symbiont TaxID=1918948 RepID=A0A1T2KRA5_9GAMM|nr:PQQ-dependent sugar dehydrogenase [Solemya velesiana gill symbiont]OOZ35394.1 glucose dehydrogenase [Solemya velesiana gill symbiont]
MLRDLITRQRLLFASLLVAVILAALYVTPHNVQAAGFKAVTLVKGLEHPWGMAFLPDGRVLVTERPGRLRLIENNRLLPEPVKGLPEIAAHGQGGLLDVALHPDYADNGWIYLAYVARGIGGTGTEVGRGRLQGNRLVDWQLLFQLQPKSGTGRHFGSRLVFDGAGYLYITIGDRGERKRAQKLGDHAGSVIRLYDDGRVPGDNPFVDTAGARPEIYSYGHRNPQGAVLHPDRGALWIHEHGPQGGDEINVIAPATNYGWPVISYGAEYGIGIPVGEGTHKPGMAQPIYYWVPSIAPSGMMFYNGDKFPQWRGNLFVGSLKFQLLVRLETDGEKVLKEERLLKGQLGRIRDVRNSPDGYIYLLTDASDGQLVRLEPAD